MKYVLTNWLVFRKKNQHVIVGYLTCISSHKHLPVSQYLSHNGLLCSVYPITVYLAVLIPERFTSFSKYFAQFRFFIHFLGVVLNGFFAVTCQLVEMVFEAVHLLQGAENMSTRLVSIFHSDHQVS